jgi:hypothetical protein
MKFDQIMKGFAIVLLALVVVFAGFIIIMVSTIQNTTQKALEPFSQAGDYLGTQSALIFNPTPTVIPDPVTIIHEIRSLARLETVQYSMEKIITAEIGQGDLRFFFGDRLLFVAHGKVIAGIDLEKLTPEDMWVETGVLNVRLPDAEIFITTLDNELSYVYDRDTGILTRGDINLETVARQAAEREIQTAALEDGVLDWASRNAENYMARLFRNLGYRDVIFVRD